MDGDLLASRCGLTPGTATAPGFLQPMPDRLEPLAPFDDEESLLSTSSTQQPRGGERVKRRRTTPNTSKACASCRRSKVKCNEQKPCSRCIRNSWRDSCVESSEKSDTTAPKPARHEVPPSAVVCDESCHDYGDTTPSYSETASDAESLDLLPSNDVLNSWAGGCMDLHAGVEREPKDATSQAVSGNSFPALFCSSLGSHDSAVQADGRAAIEEAAMMKGALEAIASKTNFWLGVYARDIFSGTGSGEKNDEM